MARPVSAADLGPKARTAPAANCEDLREDGSESAFQWNQIIPQAWALTHFRLAVRWAILCEDGPCHGRLPFVIATRYGKVQRKLVPPISPMHGTSLQQSSLAVHGSPYAWQPCTGPH
jgi:hypothetical protein